jgi:hypothetical protein
MGVIGWIYAHIPPPRHFIAAAMELTVVTSTQWHGELIAYLAPKGAMLRESQVMCIGGLPAANQASLLGNRSDMIPITNSPLLGQGQSALIDLRQLRLSLWLAVDRRRRVLDAIDRKCPDSRSEHFLNPVGVGVRQFILFDQPPMRPDGGVIA